MKLSPLLLSAVIALGGVLSGEAMADRDYDRGHGWGDRGHSSYRHDRGYRGHSHYGKPYKYRRDYYVYRPVPYYYAPAPRYSDGWYGIQLFLGGDL